MIELPLTPQFFKKLGIYQELSEIVKKYPDKRLWKMESYILKWTARGHKHLASSISKKYIEDRLREGHFNEEEISKLSGKVMGNLCQRGFAVPISVRWEQSKLSANVHEEIISAGQVAVDTPDLIVFTQNGLIAGSVLSEIDKGSSIKYTLFLWAIWLTLGILFVQITIIPITQFIKNIISSLPTFATRIEIFINTILAR